MTGAHLILFAVYSRVLALIATVPITLVVESSLAAIPLLPIRPAGMAPPPALDEPPVRPSYACVPKNCLLFLTPCEDSITITFVLVPRSFFNLVVCKLSDITIGLQVPGQQRREKKETTHPTAPSLRHRRRMTAQTRLPLLTRARITSQVIFLYIDNDSYICARTHPDTD